MIGKLSSTKWNDNPYQIALNRRLASGLPRPLQVVGDPGVPMRGATKKLVKRTSLQTGSHLLTFGDSKLPAFRKFLDTAGKAGQP